MSRSREKSPAATDLSVSEPEPTVSTTMPKSEIANNNKVVDPPAETIQVPERPVGRSQSASPCSLSNQVKVKLRMQEWYLVQLKDIANIIDEDKQKLTPSGVEFFVSEINSLHAKFNEEHNWLLNNWEEQLEDHEYVQKEHDIEEVELVLHMRRVLGEIRDRSSKTEAKQIMHEPRLPELTIPTFDGDYMKWLTFKATFHGIIGHRTDVSDHVKFLYLVAAMKGIAADMIKSLSPVDGSYEDAMKMLTNRFENKRLILTGHINKIMALRPMTRRSSRNLDKLCNIIGEYVQVDRSLGCTNCNDHLLVHIATSILDKQSRERWEETVGQSRQYPTVQQFTTWLREWFFIVQYMEMNLRPQQSTTRKSNVHHAKTTLAKSQAVPTVQPSTSRPRRVNYPCDCCGEDHYITTCRRFHKQTIHERLQTTKREVLCFNCLGHHNVRNCRSKQNCKPCGKRHNSLLHGSDVDTVFGPGQDHFQQ